MAIPATRTGHHVSRRPTTSPLPRPWLTWRRGRVRPEPTSVNAPPRTATHPAALFVVRVRPSRITTVAANTIATTGPLQPGDLSSAETLAMTTSPTTVTAPAAATAGHRKRTGGVATSGLEF